MTTFEKWSADDHEQRSEKLRNDAARYLKHYFRLALPGLGFDSEAEIEDIAHLIVESALHKILAFAKALNDEQVATEL